jgi:large subunit ribosomal protein L5
MNNYTPRLLAKYNSESINALSKKLEIKNVMRLPKVKKVVLNMGIGEAREDKNTFKQALNELTIITGQLANPTKAKKAISNFKVREGDVVGASVTLRKVKMYEFLDRLISIASPRIRDFNGFPSKGFDGRGNYNFGITEQIVFPEINYDKVNSIRGMNITIVTSAQTDYEAYELLVSLGFPINEYKNKKSGKGLSSSDKSNKPTVEEDLSLNEDANVDNVNQETTEEESS